ncbi:hypothetical protein ACQ4PT_067810 [Festuca glaucescens]
MGDAAANAPNRGRLASILLARKPRFTDSTNDTTATATAKSKDGYTMALSFWMADPPQLSLFSIHYSKPPGSRYAVDPNFSVWPHVVGADGPFVLLRASFYAAAGSREYFLYKAAGDAAPSLERIPSPDELGYHDNDDLRGVREFGILRHGGGGGGHCLVAALRDAPSSSSDDYQLRIYSSERKSWSTRTLQNPCPGVDRVVPDKVITLGQGGLLGWVDLSHGLLACDLLRLQDPDSDPTAAAAVSFFIPMPQPLPGNRGQNGWSSETWNMMVKSFNSRHKHVQFTKSQIQDKEKDLKKDYRMLRDARKHSGVGWDEERCMIQADPHLWDNLEIDKVAKVKAAGRALQVPCDGLEIGNLHLMCTVRCLSSIASYMTQR